MLQSGHWFGTNCVWRPPVPSRINVDLLSKPGLEELVRPSFTVLPYDEVAAAWHCRERARLGLGRHDSQWSDCCDRLCERTHRHGQHQAFAPLKDLQLENWSKPRARQNDLPLAASTDFRYAQENRNASRRENRMVAGQEIEAKQRQGATGFSGIPAPGRRA
jgi:hypothetical protein